MPVLLVGVALAGLVVGSFLDVVIHRIVLPAYPVLDSSSRPVGLT